MKNEKFQTLETIGVGATALTVAGAIGYTALRVVDTAVKESNSNIKRTGIVLCVGAAVATSTIMLAKAVTTLVHKINE